MTANDIKSYFSYLNKLVDQCNNIWVRIIKYNNIVSKGYTKNWSRETLILCWKLTLELIKIKIWTEKK